MDIEDTEGGSGDTVNGVDRVLVGAGVAALALLPTYWLLIAHPARLAPRLDPHAQPAIRLPFLGPGLFFVSSLLFALLASSLLIAVIEPPDEVRIEAARQTGAAFSIGAAIGGLMSALEDR
ncbi:MAG: hypothetical protein WBF53_00535, partial [Litorimonas sp.]